MQRKKEAGIKVLAFAIGLAVFAAAPRLGQSRIDPDQPSTYYSFVGINYPDDTFTQLLGINNNNVIAGYHNATANQGFTVTLPGPGFTTENYPMAAQTQVIGINTANSTTVGFYIDSSGANHGFWSLSGKFHEVNYPGEPFNQLLGTNNVGQAAGYYSTKADGSGPDHAYVYNYYSGVFELLVIPGSTSAQATGINDAGNVCGFTVDSKGVNHGFVLIGGYLWALNYPSSTFTQALGLNNNGQVVGSYMDSMGNTHGFVWTYKTRSYQSVDDPSGVGTTVVNGINDNGALVGYYGSGSNNYGFLAVPE